MRERVDIVVPEAVLERNEQKQALRAAAGRLEVTPRIPVVMNTNQWWLQAARRAPISEYLAGPRENLRSHLLNLKWRIEHVSCIDDEPIPTTSVTFQPNVGEPRGTEFPLEWQWPDGQPPKCRHLLTEAEQIDTLRLPEPNEGLNAQLIDWYHQMKQMAGDFDLRLNGNPLAINITKDQFGGPVPSAFALAGENLFYWMAAEPERVHRLMDLVTTSFLRCKDYFDDLVGRPRGGPTGMGADSAEMISPEMFREFVVPYLLRVWEKHPGPHGLHMCGRIDHLLEILRDELKITTLDGFGFPVSPRRLAEAMGGRVVLRGGPSPMLLHSGPVEAIERETRRYLDCFARRGGYVLMPGGGLVPGTSAAHMQAMVRTAREYCTDGVLA